MPQPPPARRGARGRSSRDHTPERVLAVAGVLALLVVFVVIVSLISGAATGGSGSAENQAASATAEPARTPSPTPTPTPTPTPVPLTAAERAERQAAADVVASRGFEVVRLRDWDPKDTLRVLIGRSSSGGRLAFFFVNGDYIGNDSSDASARLSVRRTSDLAATLRYRIYAPGDSPDRPTGETVDVRFRWNGASLQPETALPAPSQRTPGRQPG
jgi:hypothetical protein